MLKHEITRNGRAYLLAAHAAREAYVCPEALRLHSNRGEIPYITEGGHRYYNLDDIRGYFTTAHKTRTRGRPVYKQDDVRIDGRLCHPLRWYVERYRVNHYQLAFKLPNLENGTRMRYIAEDDFNASPYGGRKREEVKKR